MKNSYEPPFRITDDILNLVADISEQVGRLSPIPLPLHLRKNNKIRSIHSSLAIENNSLSLGQVSAIIDGKKIVGLKREIDEVKNASACYELISKLSVSNSKDLLKAHSIMMNGLVRTAGSFRTGGVAVYKGEEVVHMAPPYQKVPELVERLMEWLRTTDIHPLIASSVFHYEFEFIHPFADGNGRMGRFWQSLILNKWNKIFAYLPIETVIYENQQEYYEMLNISDKSSDSTSFIKFMLTAINKAIHSFANPAKIENEYVAKLIRVLGNDTLSAVEIMKKLKLKNRANFRKNYLVPALNEKVVVPISDIPNNPKQKYRRA